LTGLADGAAADGVVDLWIPERSSSTPSVTGAGLGSVRLVEVPGGYRALIPVTGNYQGSVTPR
jgi:hypothetical protein